MARPIVFVPPAVNGAGSKDHIRDAAEKHADAIASGLEVLQLLHDRGVLNLLRGMLGAGDQVIDKLSDAMDSPDAIRGIRNFVLLTKFFSTIPPEVLNSLVQTAVAGAEREKAQDAPGLLQLLRRLNSQNCRHALAVTLELLESVGKGL